jgi:hypothetical protein
MQSKLKVLAAGVLAALAISALPGMASAGEFTADCETGAVCEGTISGGTAEFVNTAGEGFKCTSIGGNATLTSGSSTGTVSLVAKGCKEQITGFGFSCNNTGVAGEIKTGSLVGHGIYVEPEKKLPGILITNVNLTFNCAGFAKKTVTGNVIGADPTPECGVFKSQETETLSQTSPGVQQYKQVTTSGTVFDLMTNNDAGGAYLTSSLTGTATITAVGTKVKATC